MHVCLCVRVCVCVCACVCVCVCLAVRINEWKWCLFMSVSYINHCAFADVKLGLVVGMIKQMLNDKEVDTVNC